MEKDEEFTGSQSHYDFGARIYDGRIGRWLAVDPLRSEFPYESPFIFGGNTPIQAVDIDGERVYFIVYAIGHLPGDLEDAAITRKQEIEGDDAFDPKEDHVYMLQVEDFGKLKEVIESNLEDANKNGYGKTVELSFFTHSASDGPRGSAAASSGSLTDVTGDVMDSPQLSPETWKSIDFNFDPEESISSFYGCNSSEFALKFLSYQENLKYSAGTQSKTAGSYSYDGEFDNVGWNFWGSDVYQVGHLNKQDTDPEADYYEYVVPMLIYSQSSEAKYEDQDVEGNYYDSKDEYKEIYGNPTVDRKSKEPISQSE